jgi:hypothetical protein
MMGTGAFLILGVLSLMSTQVTPPPCDPALARVIAMIESSGNAHAMRFEPAFVPDAASQLEAERYNGVNSATARVLCAMSFGLYQIMGANLYDLGLACGVVDYMNNPVMQLAFFTKYLNTRALNFKLSNLLSNPTDLHTFAIHYNGSAAYADAICVAAAKLSA